ncbi:MAG TPA: sulfite exporter TauE/SafE family protein [Gemmatimonadaceae bacterium]|nr:sulfite exporter TauE/SafE family protein [Gemmatimonadaceae bacterium]
MNPTLHLVAVIAISAIAGAMNAVAGGGTLLTFPALIGLGIPPLTANATSTVALWPGSASSFWGYRRELRGARQWAIGFAIPSLLGGAVGALLLLATDERTFSALVPWLVLGATVLFMGQGPLGAWLRRRQAPAAGDSRADGTDRFPKTRLLVFQFLIGIYGGYFGAGAGILMLAALGLMGLTNIHRMNGLKNWGGLCMNAVAAITFAVSGLVNWPVAASMAVGAIGGGYLGSRGAQRVSQRTVRWVIIGIGLFSGVWLLLNQ